MRTPGIPRPASPVVAGALLLAAHTLPACDSDVVYGPDGSGGDRTARGDYTVRRANAQSLPALVRRGSASRVEVLSGSLQLERDGDRRFTLRVRVTALGITSTSIESERCRWSQTGADLRVWWDDRSTGTGRYEGGARVQLDLATTNNIFWLGVGPQLMAPTGPVRPYVHGTAGLTYFATSSSVKGRGNRGDSFAEGTNLGDTRFAWGAGAGVLVPVHHGARTLVFADLGVQYRDSGRDVRYLREGGIRDLPDGDVELDVIRSRADMVTWHLGVSIGGR